MKEWKQNCLRDWGPDYVCTILEIARSLRGIENGLDAIVSEDVIKGPEHRLGGVKTLIQRTCL